MVAIPKLGHVLIRDAFDKYIDTGVITVSEFARRIGVTRAQVYNWRKGTSTPRQDNLERIVIELDTLLSSVIKSTPLQ